MTTKAKADPSVATTPTRVKATRVEDPGRRGDLVMTTVGCMRGCAWKNPQAQKAERTKSKTVPLKSEGCGTRAKVKNRTRLFWAARLRFKARALLAPGGAQKREGCGTRPG
jgi:hypothetical protein